MNVSVDHFEGEEGGEEKRKLYRIRSCKLINPNNVNEHTGSENNSINIL